MLVFGGSEGGLRITALASLLAAHGHPTLALAYFAEPGLPTELRNIRSNTSATRSTGCAVGRRCTAAVSSSRAAPTADLVNGVIALSPTDLISAAPGDLSASAWTLNGRPLLPARPIANIATVTQAKTQYGVRNLGGTRTADERAREQAWPRMLAWHARLSHRTRRKNDRSS